MTYIKSQIKQAGRELIGWYVHLEEKKIYCAENRSSEAKKTITKCETDIVKSKESIELLRDVMQTLRKASK